MVGAVDFKGLEDYVSVSGQKVNQQKSCVVIHVNFPRIRKHSIVEISGFQTKEFPVTYWDARYM
mgnify:CR=1 FL=1